VKPLTLCLMTGKGHAFLSDIVDAYGHLIEEVIVGIDATLDNDHSQDLANLCDARGLSWRFRAAANAQPIRSPYVMAVSWRWMIDHPETGLIVFHDSLLPRYRGFNPLVTALINGDAETGVTALLGAKEYDSGDILAQSSVSLTYPVTIASAIDLLRSAYRVCAVHVLESIDAGRPLVGQAQDETGASYSLWRDEDDYRIDWSWPAERIARAVDALGSPYKGASTRIGDTFARVHKARAMPDVEIANRTPGKVIRILDGCPVVVCGEGLLHVRELVREDTGASLLPLAQFRTRFA
jgi:methionyl-tRNA formyltransferase